MKKIAKTLSIFILIFISCFLFFSCTNGENDENEQSENEKEIVSISVDRSSIPQNVYAGEVKITQIMLNVKYDNDETEKISLTNEYLSVNSLNKLLEIGPQNIEVVYEGCKCNFTIVLLDPDVVQYTLVVNGGKPISINGKAISYDISDGNFSARFDKGTEIIIDWTEEEGKVFSYWQSGNEIVDNQRRTSITMNRNYEYTAFSTDYLYSATFVTYNPTFNLPLMKAKTINNSTDITSEMTMDNYVFVGWTTKEISRTDALSGEFDSEDLVVFPYNIDKNITFYAVWTPIGFQYTTISLEYAGKRIDGKQIVSYTGSLKELSIPSNSEGQDVVAISKDAFSQENAKVLTKINIPSTIISIEEGSFRNCSSLQTFYVDVASRNFSAEKGALYQNDKSVLVAYPSGRVSAEYELEPAVTKICDYAFYNAVLGGIVMASDVRSIGDYAFNSIHIDYVDFSALKSDVLKEIGVEVFSDRLVNLCVDSLEEIAYKSIFSNIQEKIINDESLLDAIFIQEKESGTFLFRLISGKYFDVTSRTAEIIGFTRTSVESVIPKTFYAKNADYLVTSIGYYAFKDCKFVENVILPEGLERVCDFAFDDTLWAQNKDDKSIIANNTLYKYYGKNEDYYLLGENIKRIAEGAFAYNNAIEAIDITSNNVLERIDAYAFDGCSKLSSFTTVIGSSLLIKPSLKSIAPYAFRGVSFKSIETSSSAIEDGCLKNIGEYAFADNYYLENANFSMNTLEEFATTVFWNCNSMQGISVGENNSFVTYEGILYEKKQNEEYSLFYYPSGRINGVFNPSKPNSTTTLNVVSLGEYSLYNCNIGALELEENVVATNALAIYIPSLAYVHFKSNTTLHNTTYNAVFAKSGVETIVFETMLDNDIIFSFFGRNTELSERIKSYDIPCDFYYENQILYAIYADKAYIVGSDRTSRAVNLTIQPSVKLGEQTYDSFIINKYSFVGHNLLHLTVTNVSEFKQYALKFAYNLNTLTIDEKDPIKVPIIYSESLGDNFNKSLIINVNCDPTAEGGYFEKWDGIIETFDYNINGIEYMSSRYMIYGNPFAVLTYLDKDNIRHTSSIENGQIIGSNLLAVNGQKPGYSVGKWFDITNEDIYIPLTDGYVLSYNFVAECEWVPDTIKIFFVVPDGISLQFEAVFIDESENGKRYSKEIVFGTEYNFSIIDSEENKFVFDGWSVNGKIIMDRGVWDVIPKNGTANLTPIRTKKEYRIKYDNSDSLVTINESGKIVYYGENYSLNIPQKSGFDFIGWQVLGTDGVTKIDLTDKNGASYTEWRIVSNEPVTVYPKWKAQIIKVSLYLGNEDKYGDVNIEYWSNNYKIELNSNLIPSNLQNLYPIDKLKFFAGWQDNSGKIYVDADGNSIAVWDKYEQTNLYAVWPEFVSNVDDLYTIIENDATISVVLENDIIINSPIDVDYQGVFNGNGKTITFNQNITQNEFVYGGLFKTNSGTIKNILINANMSAELIGLFEGKAYIGILCGVNNGTIENVKLKIEEFNVTLGDIKGEVYLGGVTGINNGTIRSFTGNVTSFRAKCSSVVGKLFVGTLVGKNIGSISFNELNVSLLSVIYGDKAFGGELNTIGSIIGANSYFDETMGKTVIGSIEGSYQYKSNLNNSEYTVFIDATAKANSLNVNGEWENEFSDFYEYNGDIMETAQSVYSANKNYYETQNSIEDYFSNENNCFGAGRSGNHSGLTYRCWSN